MPGGPELTVLSGERLLDVLDDQELSVLPTACRGATCGTCAVRVLRGGELLEEAGRGEKETLRALGRRGDERLGCQVVVRGEGEIVLEVVRYG